jgi:hypothetical protein
MTQITNHAFFVADNVVNLNDSPDLLTAIAKFYETKGAFTQKVIQGQLDEMKGDQRRMELINEQLAYYRAANSAGKGDTFTMSQEAWNEINGSGRVAANQSSPPAGTLATTLSGAFDQPQNNWRTSVGSVVGYAQMIEDDGLRSAERVTRDAQMLIDHNSGSSNRKGTNAVSETTPKAVSDTTPKAGGIKISGSSVGIEFEKPSDDHTKKNQSYIDTLKSKLDTMNNTSQLKMLSLNKYMDNLSTITSTAANGQKAVGDMNAGIAQKM